MNTYRFAFQSTTTILMALAFLTTGGCYVRTTARTRMASS